ncbi:MAG: MlaD family protein [Candidatus Sericytochromatia bacterium]
MALNTNVKVGVTVTLFSALALGSLLWLSNFDPSKKVYQLQGNFTNVGGLIPGSKVYLMGVQIGKVTATVPELNKVKVLMEIDDSVKF